MKKENYVAKEFFKKIYNELSKEIKKDEYKNTYAFYDYTSLALDNNILENVTIGYREDIIYIYHFGCIDLEYYTDDFKNLFKGLIDFNKLKKIEDDYCEHSLQDLLNNETILNIDKFLNIYIKENAVSLFENINLKELNLQQLINLYFTTVFNSLNWEDKTENFLKGAK